METNDELNEIASLYYSKIIAIFSLENVEKVPELESSLVSEKFYYLLCLFSLSNKNSNKFPHTRN